MANNVLRYKRSHNQVHFIADVYKEKTQKTSDRGKWIKTNSCHGPSNPIPTSNSETLPAKKGNEQWRFLSYFFTINWLFSDRR